MRRISASVGMVSAAPRCSIVVVSRGSSRISRRTPVSTPSRLPRICTGRATRAVLHPATDSSCASTSSKRRRRSARTWSASRENRWAACRAAAVPPTSTASGRICCKRAALDSTRSQSGSGAMGFDMVQPEVMALRAGVAGAMAADALDPVEQRLVPEGGAAEIGPIPPPAPGDDVVDDRGGEALVVEVAVQHRPGKPVSLHGTVVGSSAARRSRATSSPIPHPPSVAAAPATPPPAPASATPRRSSAPR